MSKALSTLAAALSAAPSTKSVQPTTVALRGGQAVSAIRLTDKQYRVGATHNNVWWSAMTAAFAKAKGQPVAVAPLLLTANNPSGVPARFIAYTLRRGYITSGAVPAKVSKPKVTKAKVAAHPQEEPAAQG